MVQKPIFPLVVSSVKLILPQVVIKKKILLLKKVAKKRSKDSRDFLGIFKEALKGYINITKKFFLTPYACATGGILYTIYTDPRKSQKSLLTTGGLGNILGNLLGIP